MLPRPHAPPAFPTVAIQTNIFVGDPAPGKKLVHYVFADRIPVSYREDLSIRMNNSVIEDWAGLVVKQYQESILETLPKQCRFCLGPSPAPAGNVHVGVMYPMQPTDAWKTGSIKADGVLGHARMPFMALELASSGAFPGISGEGEDLVDKVLDRLGASGPMFNALALPICHARSTSHDCRSRAYEASRAFLNRIHCRMGMYCIKHGEDCPGSGIPALQETLKDLSHKWQY